MESTLVQVDHTTIAFHTGLSTDCEIFIQTQFNTGTAYQETLHVNLAVDVAVCGAAL